MFGKRVWNFKKRSSIFRIVMNHCTLVDSFAPGIDLLYNHVLNIIMSDPVQRSKSHLIYWELRNRTFSFQ